MSRASAFTHSHKAMGISQDLPPNSQPGEFGDWRTFAHGLGRIRTEKAGVHPDRHRAPNEVGLCTQQPVSDRLVHLDSAMTT